MHLKLHIAHYVYITLFIYDYMTTECLRIPPTTHCTNLYQNFSHPLVMELLSAAHVSSCS